MSRLMSVSLTEQAVVERRKTVTRRLGWTFLKPGDRLSLCRKVMGRKPGEPLVRLAEVEVVSVRREELWHMGHEDVAREGVPGWDDPEVVSAWDWVEWFWQTMRCNPWTEVTRIEWRYLDTVSDDGVVAGGAVDAIARSGPAGGISEEDQQP